MPTVSALAAHDASTPRALAQIDRRELDRHEVLSEIKYAGVCHSDIHAVRGDWDVKQYPLVPGHEIAGIVIAIGEAVTTRAVGDRVGVGCQVNSCRECAKCRHGQ